MHLAALPVAATLAAAASGLEPARRPRAILGALGLLACLPVVGYLLRTPPSNLRLRAVREVAARLRWFPPGAVLSQWMNGHALARIGRHPVVASPLLTPTTMEAAEEATRALLEEDPALTLEWMDRRHVRYLVATALPSGVTERYLTALHDSRPAEAVRSGATVTRLMAPGGGVPGLRPLFSSADGRAKVFERISSWAIQ
jgi:hypothetical protein